MGEWKTLDELPEIGETVIVAAWEFGKAPSLMICHYWHSTAPDQPPKFYLDQNLYHLACPMEVADQVHYWLRIPKLTQEQIEKG